MNSKELAFLAKTAYKEWREKNETTRAAALAFFIILPLPTLLIIIAGVLAIFFGPEQAVEILTKADRPNCRSNNRVTCQSTTSRCRKPIYVTF